MKAALEENRDVLNGQLVRDVQQTLRDANWNLGDLPKFLKNIIELGAWKHRVLPNPLPGEGYIEFESFTEFVTEPLLRGLGTTVKHLQNICRDDKEALLLIDQAIRNPNGRPPKKETLHNVQGSLAPTGNTHSAALRRLHKSRPDLLSKVLKGELSSNSAMIEAGFRQKSLNVPLDPEKAAAAIKRHFNEEQIAKLIALLLGAN
jgi:hypothetical protein